MLKKKQTCFVCDNDFEIKNIELVIIQALIDKQSLWFCKECIHKYVNSLCTKVELPYKHVFPVYYNNKYNFVHEIFYNVSL